MSNFTTLEMVNMIFILGECARNCLLASRVYAERYPDIERKPRPKTFEKLLQRFVATGSTAYTKRMIINKPVINEENELRVLLVVEENH